MNNNIREQSRDTGMAMVLICLLLEIYTHHQQLIVIATLLLIVNMIYPKMYKPFAIVWFGFSRILGTVTSKIVLTVIFFLLITPVGVFRKIIGIDSMQIKRWKKDTSSVFKKCDYCYKPVDIEKPY